MSEIEDVINMLDHLAADGVSRVKEGDGRGNEEGVPPRPLRRWEPLCHRQAF